MAGSRWGHGVFVAWLCTAGIAQAETLAELQAKRAQIIGPEIARGADFTVHAPGAVAAGGTWRCAAPGAAMSEAEYERRRAVYAVPLQAQKDAIRDEKTALSNRRRANPAMPADEYQKQYAALNARETQIGERWAEEDRKLQQAQRESVQSGSGYLSLFVVHAPTDAARSIIPLQGLEPTDAYVGQLSKQLGGFLASCGARDQVSVAHVYRDFFPAGVDVELRWEKPILVHSYTLRNGNLALVRGRPGNSSATSDSNGGAQNLTLAGARGRMGDVLEEEARQRGDYRAEFALAAKRKSGIVYRLEPYWKQYAQDIGLDAARRVFDGDFVGQSGTVNFKAQVHGFSEIYSSRCRAEIPSFKRFYIPSSRVTATRTYLSGRVENDYERTVIEVDIDSRFAPFYESYEDAARSYLMASMGKIHGERGSAANWTMEDVRKVIDQSLSFNIWLGFFRQHTCTSATMLQMRDNLLRAANGEPSAQAAGVQYPGAAQESDPAR